MHLGRPWPQNDKGHLLGDVTDQGKSGYDPTSRGNEIGGVAVPVPLRRLRPRRPVLPRRRRQRRREPGGQRGGDPQRARPRRQPELAAELYEPFAYDFRGEQRPGTKPWYLMPVFTRQGRPAVRALHPALHPLGPPPRRRPARRRRRPPRRWTVSTPCAPTRRSTCRWTLRARRHAVREQLPRAPRPRRATRTTGRTGRSATSSGCGSRPTCSPTTTSRTRSGWVPPPTPGGRRPGSQPSTRDPMADATARAAHFLALHRPGEPLLAPNPWDVGSAKLLESLGFEALCTTSSGAAATLGGLDGSMDRAAAVASAGAIAPAVTVPVSADLENGFGDEPDAAAETIRQALARRAVRRLDRGLHDATPTIPSTRSSSPPRGWRRPPRWRTPDRCTSCSPPAPRTTSAAATTSPTRSPACRRTRRPAPTCSTRPG